MKILLCPDKFKGSLSAMEVCRAIDAGLKKSQPQAETVFHPMADGGDGSLEILADHLDLKPQQLTTTDPLGREISATYFTAPEAAFIEVASASGLVLLKNEERNPLLTTTFGTGHMMVDAIRKGCENIYLFLGGSATNDAGMGIATALGCQFLDKYGLPLEPTGGNLPKVQSIQPSHLFDFQKIKMTLLCDVTNPLFGISGAAHVYARQKGAMEEQVEYLDDGLRHFSQILQQHTGMDVGSMLGSGAAGGIGASLVALFGAKMESGFTVISELTGLEKQIQTADLVICGEGKLDSQTLEGKVINGVMNISQKHQKPLLLIVGQSELNKETLADKGIVEVLTVMSRCNSVEKAVANAGNIVETLVFDYFNAPKP